MSLFSYLTNQFNNSLNQSENRKRGIYNIIFLSKDLKQIKNYCSQYQVSYTEVRTAFLDFYNQFIDPITAGKYFNNEVIEATILSPDPAFYLSIDYKEQRSHQRNSLILYCVCPSCQKALEILVSSLADLEAWVRFNYPKMINMIMLRNYDSLLAEMTPMLLSIKSSLESCVLKRFSQDNVLASLPFSEEQIINLVQENLKFYLMEYTVTQALPIPSSKLLDHLRMQLLSNVVLILIKGECRFTLLLTTRDQLNAVMPLRSDISWSCYFPEYFDSDRELFADAEFPEFRYYPSAFFAKNMKDVKRIANVYYDI